MRIQHLNTDDLGGGAFQSGMRLHQALQEAGLDSRMLVGAKRSGGDADPALPAYCCLLEATRSERLVVGDQ